MIYLGYKNDVSFIVRGTLNLYEHQSTLNPNMPIRGLIYFGKQYESYIKQHNLNIYGKKCFRCRFRSLLFFIMGLNRWKMAKIIWNCIFRMMLHPDVPHQNTHPISTCLECTARVYNINYGHNQELMARCRTLEEYSILIGRISSNVRNGIPLEPAADAAVQECIRNGI